MARELFPWQDNEIDDKIPGEQSQEAPGVQAVQEQMGLKQSFKKLMPIYILVILVVIVMIFRPQRPAPIVEENYVDVVVVMMPTPKGQELVPETLKAVPVREKSLTKNQALQRIQIDDLNQLRGQIVAKKNLPPNKPLFWSDVDFKLTHTNPQQKKSIRVHYPKEN